MQIQHNLSAMTANRQLGINSTNYSKDAEKLASGYKINTAADGAAELQISEKMRYQIRGLKRSLKNAEEGDDFIRVADGAMTETHSVLHRMRELSVQSLNDTNTPADRAAMAAEFDQLQCELDRINDQTYFNSIPVFDKYLPSYQKIEGERVWYPNQLHTIAAPDNDLSIHLPEPEPDGLDYSITVEDGIYTTQELIDEIDDAFENMSPKNPGFVLEFTSEGFCDLIYQKEEGDTEITSVDGHLTYLLFDKHTNTASTSLLGTTIIAAGSPLHIKKGLNDELTFYAAPNTTPYTINLAEGAYSREQLIDALNEHLKDLGLADKGIVAKDYGESSIQITGGPATHITGLKGNMFTINDDTSIHSVFYDNVCEGTVTNRSDYITSAAYYLDGTTTTISIPDDTTLKVKINGDSDYTELDIPKGDYIIDPDENKKNNLYTALKGLEKLSSDIKVTVTGYSYSGYRLHIESTKTGNASSLEFDKNNAYDLLFRETHIRQIREPSYTNASKPTEASLTGRARLGSQNTFTIPDGANKLSIQAGNGDPINITIPSGSYSLTSLVSALNSQLSQEQKEKILFTKSNDGNFLRIEGQGDSVTSITASGSAYEQLFKSREIAAYAFNKSSPPGLEQYTEGNTKPDFKASELVLDRPIPEDRTVINSSNHTLSFTLGGIGSYSSSRRINVTIPDSNASGYTREELVNKLNEQLQSKKYPVTASLRDNKLVLTTQETGENGRPYIHVNSHNGGNAWEAFLGTTETDLDAIRSDRSNGQPACFTSNVYSEFKFSGEVKAPNNTFKLTYNGSTKTITIPAQTYSDRAQLAGSIKTAIKKQFPNADFAVAPPPAGSQIIITCEDDFTIADTSKDNSDSFYRKVFGGLYKNDYSGNPTTATKPLHNLSEIFIIGRQDVRTNKTVIVQGFNDEFTMDLSYKPFSGSPINYTLTVHIPPGEYSGTGTDPNLADTLEKLLNEELEKQQAANNDTNPLHLDVEVGGQTTSVAGAEDKNALSITLKDEPAAADGTQKDALSGSYCLDGVRGNASYSIFYKTVGSPTPTYVIGVNDLTGGVTFGPHNKILKLTVDGKPFTFTYDEGYYTPDELLKMLNQQFKDQNCPLSASLDHGRLKLTSEVSGHHTIENISGSARDTLFYRTRSREKLPAFMLQTGASAYQGIELPRLRVGTVALRVNSLTITRPKYANKALNRLDQAISLTSSKRSLYGAIHNRLEHVVANNGNTAENIQASESRIRDADMADEIISHSIHNILMQASQAVLAQAQQTPYNVLNLLR